MSINELSQAPLTKQGKKTKLFERVYIYELQADGKCTFFIRNYNQRFKCGKCCYICGMEKLLETVNKNTFHYKLVKRTKKKAIYAQYLKEKDLTPYAYEVFKIKVAEPRVLFGRQYPLREVFPNNEAFGNTAWVFWGLKDAEVKYAKM